MTRFSPRCHPCQTRYNLPGKEEYYIESSVVCCPFVSTVVDVSERKAMNVIYLMSACGFIRAGLEALNREWLDSVRIIGISEPEELLTAPPVSGNSLVMVYVPPDNVAEAARGMLFWRRLALIQTDPNSGSRLKQIPCLLWGDHRGRTLPVRTEWLPASLSSAQLAASLQKVLRVPSIYVFCNNPARLRQQLQLSEQQEAVMASCLSGETTQDAAKRLGLSVHVVHCSRRSLLQRLGLKNRLELISLVGNHIE